MKLMCTNPTKSLTLGKEYDVKFLKKEGTAYIDVDDYTKAHKVVLENDKGKSITCNVNRFNIEESVIATVTTKFTFTDEATQLLQELIKSKDIIVSKAGEWRYKNFLFVSYTSLRNYLQSQIMAEKIKQNHPMFRRIIKN